MMNGTHHLVAVDAMISVLVNS